MRSCGGYAWVIPKPPTAPGSTDIGHLVLAQRHERPCFVRIDSISRHNHVHHFQLQKPEDLNEELCAYIKQAYEVGEQKHLKSHPFTLVSKVRQPAGRARLLRSRGLLAQGARQEPRPTGVGNIRAKRG
ncbi:hypothetical protein SBV1_1180006 [Verrucomicrobia bacterium]|nr:hypothetical protein SBV1_1180006 [Verrucomicrobiota bacterium]